MKEKRLSSTISDILLPIGFKRKSRHWILDNGSIVKIVNLQKSNFGNNFYVNYGYIIKALPLGCLKMHIYRRLGAKDGRENDEIDQVLNLEFEIPEDLRVFKLKRLLLQHLAKEMELVNTEDDLRNELTQTSCMNQLPVVVKDYFMLDN